MMHFIGILLLFSLIDYREIGVEGFANPKSDFLFEIDGNSVSVSREHACAIEQKPGSTIGGRAKCWGLPHLEGREEAPNDIDFVQVTTGLWFTCGIAVDQNVHCWGSIAGQVPGLYTQITADSDGHFACGLQVDGNINCWGDVSVELRPPPIRNSRKYVQVSCSNRHCCSLDSKGYPFCWGNAEKHELIPPEITYQEYLESKDKFAWIIKEDNIFVEENNELLADEDVEFSGDYPDKYLPTDKSFVQFRQLSVGRTLACGITLFGGHLLCWGTKYSTKFLLSQAVGPFRQVSVGDLGVCAITGDPVEFGLGGEKDTENEQEEVERPEKELPPPDQVVCWGSAKGYIDPKAYDAWDQVCVGCNQVCGVSMDSELICTGHTVPPHQKIVIA